MNLISMNRCRLLTQYFIIHFLLRCQHVVLSSQHIDLNKVLDTEEFTILTGLKQFIDKTPFLEYVMSGGSVYLTAPARFGKSTLLKMTKTFFGGRFNSSGHKITSADIRSVFTNPQRFDGRRTPLKIYDEHKKFFESHFQNYTVMFINFRPLAMTQDYSSYKENMCSVYFDTLSDLRLFYTDIPLDKKCNSLRRLISEERLVDTEYLKHCTQNFKDHRRQLKYASTCLFRCYGRHVFVLVDEWDAYLQAIMTKNISQSDLNRITPMHVDSCTSLCKGNAAVIMTTAVGVVNVGGVSTIQANNVIHRDFFFHHTLGEYFGFLDDEVDLVLERFGFEGKKETVAHYYDGYRVAGSKEKIYNPGSILNFCRNGGKVHGSFGWPKMAAWHQVLNPLFSDVEFGKRMLDSLKGNITIDISDNQLGHERLLEILKKLRNDRKINGNFGLTKTEQDIVFQYFLQSGYYTPTEDCEYFTSDSHSRDMVPVTVTIQPTNQETWLALFRALAGSKYLEYSFNVTKAETEEFYAALSDIRSNNETEYMRLLKSVHALTRGQKLRKEIDLQTFVYFACKMLQIEKKLQTHEIELTLKNGHVIDVAILTHDSSVAILIELEKDASAYAGIRQIVMDKHFTVFQEASFKQKLIRHVALIGLRCKSVKESKEAGEEKNENQCSLCYLFGDPTTRFDHKDLNNTICLEYPDNKGKTVRILEKVEKRDHLVKPKKRSETLVTSTPKPG